MRDALRSYAALNAEFPFEFDPCPLDGPDGGLSRSSAHGMVAALNAVAKNVDGPESFKLVAAQVPPGKTPDQTHTKSGSHQSTRRP
jgi:hypothetical protein